MEDLDRNILSLLKMNPKLNSQAIANVLGIDKTDIDKRLSDPALKIMISDLYTSPQKIFRRAKSDVAKKVVSTLLKSDKDVLVLKTAERILKNELAPKRRGLFRKYHIPELELNHLQIKELTPYLNGIKTAAGNKRGRGLTAAQRAFCWYYVWSNNLSEAYRRAYNIKDCGQGAYIEVRRFYIREAIARVREHVQKEIKDSLPYSLCEQLIIQATYDPAMFVNPDGSPAFKNWEEIPVKYRCCVEGIKSSFHGEIKLVEIKLVDREVARKYLIKMFPGLVEPDKLEVVHKTIDANGNEIGFDVDKATDEELRQRIIELKKIKEGFYE